ncbi:transglycosylase SLT domain-containing protein [Phocaeicola abscessus]|uniref:transglycosylase SLT domain-containing protein n=1 Tax=Phocaeicola abscessus TaxID=555313 RepID=UPI0028E398CA|nr:transglycosylase SLT domain-containing protein [Phocaeicola abscessus]
MRRVGILIILAGVLCCCRIGPREERHVDLLQIQDSGKIVALTLYGSTSYFLYRGQPMGFEYELMAQLAKSLNIELEIKVGRNQEELVQMLQRGEGDIIAYNLAITKTYKDSVLFCGDEHITHQVLVQRDGYGREKPLSDVTQLVGKEVYVEPGKYLDRLNNLNEELGGGILIRPVNSDSLSTEDLIEQVARRKIDYTICDNTLAKLNQTYFSNLHIDLAISFDQKSSWAVRKTSPLLAAYATRWHELNVASSAYKASAKRYFEVSKQIPHSPLLSLEKGIISHFDQLFRKYAGQIGWDWRMLASLAYTESNFDTTAVSWAGAKGLMQLMPATARSMGIPRGKEYYAEESIKGAVKYLKITTDFFKQIADSAERIKFVLAAYNAGVGHIADAMALAEKYGKNKYVWDHNVENYILLKSKEEYYNDPVCKNGYFRGEDTYRFVKDILSRTKEYRAMIKDE